MGPIGCDIYFYLYLSKKLWDKFEVSDLTPECVQSPTKNISDSAKHN